MSDKYLHIKKILFSGPTENTELPFFSGVNVICGASDTGKSFLVETIDFMLGGSELRDIPERAKYEMIELDVSVSNSEDWRLRRSTSGGNFKLFDLNNNDAEISLKQVHAYNKTDNLSGFFLDKLGLQGKRILKSGTKSTTQSLSFRNLAKIAIIQEDEIQQRGSPFWSGQYTTDLAGIAQKVHKAGARYKVVTYHRPAVLYLLH